MTEYTGTIDLTKAAAALSGTSKSQLQQAIKTAGLSTETVTTTITSINQPVSIAVPDAGQVAPRPTGSTSGTT